MTEYMPSFKNTYIFGQNIAKILTLGSDIVRPKRTHDFVGVTNHLYGR